MLNFLLYAMITFYHARYTVFNSVRVQIIFEQIQLFEFATARIISLNNGGS